MGWNVLLEGRKLWTFLPPSPELDAPLGTYRLAPNAFGSHNISAGWQSNVDLYKRAGETAVGGGGEASASWPSEGQGGEEVMRHAVSGVQEQGEVVLIPPRHWHQVYIVVFRRLGVCSCSAFFCTRSIVLNKTKKQCTAVRTVIAF